MNNFVNNPLINENNDFQIQNQFLNPNHKKNYCGRSIKLLCNAQFFTNVFTLAAGISMFAFSCFILSNCTRRSVVCPTFCSWDDDFNNKNCTGNVWQAFNPNDHFFACCPDDRSDAIATYSFFMIVMLAMGSLACYRVFSTCHKICNDHDHQPHTLMEPILQNP